MSALPSEQLAAGSSLDSQGFHSQQDVRPEEPTLSLDTFPSPA